MASRENHIIAHAQWVRTMFESRLDNPTEQQRQHLPFIISLHNVHRPDFMKDLTDRLDDIEDKYEIVETLLSQYQTDFFDSLQEQQDLVQTPPDAAAPDDSAFIPAARMIVKQAALLRKEREILDHLRSWKGYLEEAVNTKDMVIEFWDHLWDLWEELRYGGRVDRLDDRLEYARYMLQAAEVQFSWAKWGAEEHGRKVMDLLG